MDSYIMIRSGYGAGEIDQQFRKGAQKYNDTGIPYGVYWHSYAYTSEMAEKEAVYCLETIEEFEITYPVCFLMEEDTIRYAKSKGITITPELAWEMAEVFCRKIAEAGYFAMYYSGTARKYFKIQ